MSNTFCTRGGATGAGGAAGRSTCGGDRCSSPPLVAPRQADNSSSAAEITGAELPISVRLKKLDYQARRRDTTQDTNDLLAIATLSPRGNLAQAAPSRFGLLRADCSSPGKLSARRARDA